LSAVGTRHPEKVAALIYLDAANWYAFYDSEHPVLPPPPPGPLQSISQAIVGGAQKYTGPIRDPILAIFAIPHDLSAAYRNDPAGRATAEEKDRIQQEAQADAFQRGLPSAHVVRIPNANHFVFESNEADVLREVNAFISSLPQ
jgi:non-heme chloroperoxidase